MSFNYHNLEECLNKHIPASDLGEVKRLLYGRSKEYEIQTLLWPIENLIQQTFFLTTNCFSHDIVLDLETIKLSEQYNFEARGFSFTAEPEEVREPRIVRIAAVQNSIVEPTTRKINVQRDALHMKISKIIQAAAASKVNVICLQEAWSQ